jgi:hypothetical protein
VLDCECKVHLLWYELILGECVEERERICKGFDNESSDEWRIVLVCRRRGKVISNVKSLVVLARLGGVDHGMDGGMDGGMDHGMDEKI